MSKKEDADYQKWTKEFAATLTTDAAKAAFETLSADEAAAKELFRGYGREGDYYRRLNVLNDERKAFETAQGEFEGQKAAMLNWYQSEAPKVERMAAEKRALAAKLSAAKQQLIDLGMVEEAEALGKDIPAAMTSATTEVTSKELEQLKNQVRLLDQALPQMLASYGKVIRESVEGKWSVNPDEVLAFSIQNGLDPQQAFQYLTAEERKKREDADFEKKLESAREEGRRSALTQQASPDFMRPKGPTIMDQLRAAPSSVDRRERVSGAVAEFLEMGAGS